MAGLLRRGRKWWLKYYVAGKARVVSLRTDSLQIAKEKKRQFEEAQARGDASPLPTRTPIGVVVSRYVDHNRTIKTPKSAQTDIYYLREAFGPICPALEDTRRRLSGAAPRPPRGRHAPPDAPADRRLRRRRIEAACFEQIATAEIASFVDDLVRTRGIAPKTANRYREILCRLFNWAMKQGAVKMPSDRNPAQAVTRYKERASQIRFLTLAQIGEQLGALEPSPQLQAMVAVYIYAGLRREEAVWLTRDDVNLAAGRHGIIHVRAKTVAGESWQPKTKLNRAIPVSSDLRAYLQRYVPRRSEGGWYFPSPEGKRWDPDNFCADLRAANKEAGLHWTCLIYRHTFGSHLAQKGVSLYKISQLMGNSPEICRRHYAALVPEAMADEVEFGKAPLSASAQPAESR
jgi:integrase